MENKSNFIFSLRTNTFCACVLYPLFLHFPPLSPLETQECCIAAQPRDARVQQPVTSLPRGDFPNIYYFPAEYFTAYSHRLRNPATRDVVQLLR